MLRVVVEKTKFMLALSFYFVFLSQISPGPCNLLLCSVTLYKPTTQAQGTAGKVEIAMNISK